MTFIGDPRLFVAFAFSFLMVSASAQEPLKFSADFSVGPSFPLGKFADKNYSPVPNANGLAKTGFSMYANLRYSFSSHLGIMLAAQSSFNKQDQEAISDYINKGALAPIDSRIVTEYWRIFKLLTGLYYQGHFSNQRLSYNISILGGFCKTSVPSYSWEIYTPSGVLASGWQQNSVSQPWSFAYQAGGSLQYDLKNEMYLLFSADYFNASSQWTTSNLKYDYGSINMMFGTGFRF